MAEEIQHGDCSLSKLMAKNLKQALNPACQTKITSFVPFPTLLENNLILVPLFPNLQQVLS